MQGSYIWNKHSLFRHQIVLVLCMLCATALQAQHFKWARQHNPNYDDRKFSYGFSIGLHTTTYQVNYSDQFVTKKYDTVSAVLPQFIPGFSLGFLVNWRLNELLDFRIMPKAGFYSHRLTYYYTNRSTQSQLIETTMVELPILIKFKSMRRGNVRMYMVGGITPSIEASGKSDLGTSSSAVPILKRNLSLDAGVGFDFYFPLFKFSPELRFSRGIVNMLGDAPSIYREPLGGLNTNTIAVYFIFQ